MGKYIGAAITGVLNLVLIAIFYKDSPDWAQYSIGVITFWCALVFNQGAEVERLLKR